MPYLIFAAEHIIIYVIDAKKETQLLVIFEGHIVS